MRTAPLSSAHPFRSHPSSESHLLILAPSRTETPNTLALLFCRSTLLRWYGVNDGTKTPHLHISDSRHLSRLHHVFVFNDKQKPSDRKKKKSHRYCYSLGKFLGDLGSVNNSATETFFFLFFFFAFSSSCCSAHISHHGRKFCRVKFKSNLRFRRLHSAVAEHFFVL